MKRATYPCDIQVACNLVGVSSSAVDLSETMVCLIRASHWSPPRSDPHTMARQGPGEGGKTETNVSHLPPCIEYKDFVRMENETCWGLGIGCRLSR